MCECLRGIFRVSWTLTSHADSDREDRHGNTEAKDSPINNKRRPPPSDKPGTHLSAHHGTSPDEQDSPERIVQKEKLHAELKQVLSQKRNQLRDIQSNLINMDEPPQMDRKNEVEKDNQLSELVEVVVETQAEVGASGYSVVGGGERGIFVKEVLKDSPAAKHLSLQKGDQLLSARVYFDNVKYEDALKILQCAEPYKVSFFLKRTVPESEVSIHPSAQNLELRGPKAKMQRMSVKSVKPFKAKKRRGGRFGLKRLKENKKARDWAELDIEGSSGGPDLNPVDVEFVFPKFKVKKGGKATAVDSRHLEGVIASRKKRKIRFPKMKAKDAAVDKGDFDVDVSVHEGEDSGAKVKAKAKGPKFAMSFPRLKKSKLDVQSSNDSFEVKQQDVTCKPPTVENTYSMSQHEAKTVLSNIEITEEEKVEGSEIKLSKTNIFVSETKMSIPKFKLPKVRLSCHSDEIDGDTRMQTDLTETKTKYDTPKISLHGLTRDPKENVGDDVDGAMVKEHKISLPKSDINIPRIEVPDVDIDLSKMAKTETKTDFPKVTLEEHGAKAGKFHKPNVSISLLKITEEKQYGIDISPPHGGESVNVKENCGKGGKFEMPKLKPAITGIKIEGKEMPEIDVQLPKLKYQTGEMNLERPEIKGGRFNMPSIDISLPRREAESEVDIEGHPGIGRKIEMPRLDFSLPKIEQPVGEIHVESAEIKGGKFQKPTVEMSLPSDGVGVEAEHTGKGGRFVMPKFDVSLPKLKPPGGQFNIKDPEIKGGKFHMPSVDISLPRGGSKCDIDIKGDDKKGKTIDLPKIDDSVPKLTPSPAEIKIEGPETVKGKYDMPEIDVTLPKLKPLTGEINMEGHEIKGGKFHIPSLDISVPKGGEGRGKVIEGHAAKGGRFVMPKFDVSLPKLNASDGEFNNKDPEIKGVKLKMPSVDISLPRGGASGDVDIKGDAAKGGKFEMPKIDISLPKVKPPSVEHNIEGPDIKGGKFHMPSVDISLPRGGASGDVDIKGDAAKGGKFEMPKIDISLPKVKPPSGELSIEGPDIKGGRFHMPSVDISLPRGGASSDIDIKGDAAKIGKFEMPKVDISLPKVKPPSGELSIEGPDIKGGKFHIPSVDISLPKGGATGDVDIKGDAAKGGKFEMPKIDISLPKVKPPSGELSIEGPDIKGGKFHMPSVDISLPKGEARGDVDIKGDAAKGGNFEMPKIDISLPKVKPPSVEHNIEVKPAESELNIEGPDFKRGKFHMPSVVISLPKGGARGDVDIKGHGEKGGNFEMPNVDVSLPKLKPLETPEINVDDKEIKHGKFNMPSRDIFLLREMDNNKSGKAGADANIRTELQAPKIPELDFDIDTTKVEAGSPEEDKQKKLKIQKFGIPLPSLTSPEVNIKSSQLKGPSLPDMEYVGPSIPKVTKAVFVMVNPQIENPATIASAEIGQAEKFKQPNIKMKTSFGKSPDKGKTLQCEEEVETEAKSKPGKLKLPKVTFSPGQRGSFDVTPTGSDDSTSPGQNDDEKAKFGKLKLPKVEFFSPYSKDSSVVEEMEINTRKETSWEFKESKETKTKSAALSFTGLKTNSVKMNEEREETTWFKVPKVTLSPHSTGILHITPESSPKAIKSTLPGMSDEATGGFYVKMPSLEFLTHEMSSEQKTTRMEETHTVVTKTTKYKESKSSRSKEPQFTDEGGRHSSSAKQHLPITRQQLEYCLIRDIAYGHEKNVRLNIMQNNNNNCLNMSHRELLHECRRTNVSFSSALEFGAIPLIKGLRAWAVSGGYSKAKKKTVSWGHDTYQQSSENREKSWSEKGSSGYGHTAESTSNAMRATGVRQGGSGALVTVATLKGTEGGGRQTQTRCLFLKAQGRESYINAVGNQGAGPRVTGFGTHSVILEGTRDDLKGFSKVSQEGSDEGRLLKSKPRTIRKWRTCSKTERTKAHVNREISHQHCDVEPGDQKIVILGTEPVNATLDDTITQCQEGTSAFVTCAKDVNELGKVAQIVPENCCFSAKQDEGIEPGTSIIQSDSCSEIDPVSNCANPNKQEDILLSNSTVCLDANTTNFVDDVPNLGSEPLGTHFRSLYEKVTTEDCNKSIVSHPPFQTPSEVLASVQNCQECRPTECLLDHDNLYSVETQSNASPITNKEVGAGCISAEKTQKPSMCLKELEDQDSDKSSPRGFTASTANITVTTFNSQPNPAPTTTAAIATAIPALSKGEEEEARGGDMLFLLNSELQSEPGRVEDWDKVATFEGSLDLTTKWDNNEEEEDEFGDFMQAEVEELGMDEFKDVQQLAAEDCECNSIVDEKETASWAPDWSAGQTGSTWVAFSLQTEEQKTEPGEQWWPSTQMPKLPLSTLHNVSNVFLEAFPSEKSTCEDPLNIPTLQPLLQALNNGWQGDQSLLDRLQDLEWMMSVKHKRAESSSRKLLLQSLRLERPSFESVRVQLRTGARFSPDLASSNQQLAANAKRRLSYDFNRNVRN
ncbi:hypothetical protein DNTS_027597 [Danionella cerebrum]|uniref:Periaxin n=1 Tax=Danionella cerebrum TaxID=2873325 RepID=A0A553QW61_9TELE|nr:hypothetical protein DNTS_027597 [Danionella translucida]